MQRIYPSYPMIKNLLLVISYNMLSQQQQQQLCLLLPAQLVQPQMLLLS